MANSSKNLEPDFGEDIPMPPKKTKGYDPGVVEGMIKIIKANNKLEEEYRKKEPALDVNGNCR